MVQSPLRPGLAEGVDRVRDECVWEPDSKMTRGTREDTRRAATTCKEREEEEKERIKEAAIDVVVTWMREGGAGGTGCSADRARKFTALDQGLIGIEKYIAHLRRKKARGKWEKGDGLRWRGARMKQARMRISLEDTLIQEHCEGEAERIQ